MKTINFITICLLMVFISNVSYGSQNYGNQKTAENVKPSSPQVAMAAQINSPTSESGSADQSETIKKGEKIFKDKGCVACHQLDTKLIGPAVKEISKAYAGKMENLNSFLKGTSKSIIDPAKHVLMEPQIAITKAMSDTDRTAIVEYLLSVK